MTGRMTDEEKMAALLDGRLEESQRAELVARLASSDDALAAYAEALSVTQELEAEDEAQGVVHLAARRPRWWDRPGMRLLAAAAGLAVIVAVPWALERDGDGELEPGTFVALASAGGPIQSAERAATGWPVRRSSGVVATDRGIALRLGAELAWLEVAVRTADAEGIRRSAAEIDDLLDGLPAGAPLATVYRSVAADPARPLSELRPLLRQAGASATRIAGEEMVALGGWIEMARVAAAREQSEFFTDPATRELMASAAVSDTVPESARAVLRRLAAGLSPEGEPDWASLRNELASLPALLVTR